MIERLRSIAVLVSCLPLASRAAVSVSIDIAPPPLPVYAQPVIPAPGCLWTPGYWRWSPVDGDADWIPGTWVAAPHVGALWTPGYWGWAGGTYVRHGGYWGPHVGFYGGINDGLGYGGHGYEGSRRDGGVFSDNRSVNHVDTTIVHDVYNPTVVETNTHVGFNGGQGGTPRDPRRTNAQRVRNSTCRPRRSNGCTNRSRCVRRQSERRSITVRRCSPRRRMPATVPTRLGGGEPGRHRGEHVPAPMRRDLPCHSGPATRRPSIRVVARTKAGRRRAADGGHGGRARASRTGSRNESCNFARPMACCRALLVVFGD